MNRRAAVLVLALSLVLLPSCISAKQWERFRAHGTATTFSAVLGGLAALLGGMVGLAVFSGGVLGGVVIDQALEPEPEVHVKKTTTVVQLAPPLPDGTPQAPRVDTYSTQDDGSVSHDGARGNLKLRPLENLPNVAESLGWWEKTKRSLAYAFWVVVGLCAAAALIANDKLRGAVLGTLGWLASAAGRKIAAGARAIAAKRRGTIPPKPPGT